MTVTSSAIFEILDEPASLAERVAEWMCGIAIAKNGPLSVCLSGGSTPRALYEVLAGPRYADTFPWALVDWFWGDERFVPWNDPMSNFRMANEAMIARRPIPPSRVHPVPFDGLSPAAAASTYESTLRTFYRAQDLDRERPLFDITLLGLGTDGHTASLFPGSPILAERHRWVAVSDTHGQPRISLTYPALESSRFAAFLVAGADKRDILARVRASDRGLPAALFDPVGELRVFADREACPV